MTAASIAAQSLEGTSCDNDVRGVLRRYVLGAQIAELGQTDIDEKVFARAEEDRDNRHVHLVDEPARKYWRIVATPPPSRTSLPWRLRWHALVRHECRR